jgi:hypothetical protein
MSSDSGFATYDDFVAMADDRDDSNDPEFRAPDGYCEHGVYVGGSGIDWMCGYCEDGITAAEVNRAVRAERLRKVRANARQAETLLAKLLVHGVGGIDAALFAQEASCTVNPLSRYGRH